MMRGGWLSNLALLLVSVLLPVASAGASDRSIVATVQATHTEATLFDIHFHSSQLGWAVGSGGTLLKTVDGGKRWKKISSGPSVLLANVYFRDDKQGWVIGANGTIRTSRDGGTTWASQAIDTQAPLYGITFPSPTKGWIVGGNGTILHTNDGGASW